MQFSMHNHTSASDGFADEATINSILENPNIKRFAITDHHCLYMHRLIKYNPKIIYGVELSLNKNKYHITVLMRNKEGYKYIVSLLNKDIVTLEDLFNNEDIIVLSGCSKNIFYNGGVDVQYANKNIKHFYIELIPYPNTENINMYMLKEAYKYNIPIIITNDNHFYEANKLEHQHILAHIKYNVKFDTPFGIDSKSYCMSEEDFIKKLHTYNLGHLYDDSIKSYKEIDSLISDNALPDIIPLNLDAYYPEPEEFLRNNIDWNRIGKYETQYKKELEVIKGLNILQYFCIIADLVRFCINNNIYIGGRGSAAGSLLSYGLHITNVNPVKYNLRFDRFISETRIGYPDIDMDFAPKSAEKVIDYIINKYGSNNVVRLCTYIRFTKKSLVNNILRLASIKDIDTKSELQLNYGEVPDKILKKHPSLPKVINDFDDIIRTIGKHPAGIVFGQDIALTSQGIDVTLADKCGLVKLDILSRLQLAPIEGCIKSGIEIGNDDIQVHEYINIRNANAFTICDQIDGASVKMVNKLVKPINLTQLSDTIALGRAPAIISNQHKKYVDKSNINSILYRLCPDTNGVLLYQEQILDILNKYGNFTPEELYIARKAITKTHIDLNIRWNDFAKYKEKLFENAIKNGLTLEEITEIYDKIKDAALYSFNMAHSMSYAYNAMTAMKLKNRNPVTFFYEAIKEYGNAYYESGDNKLLFTIRNLCIEAKKFGVNFIFNSIIARSAWVDNTSIEPMLINNDILLPIYKKFQKKKGRHEIFDDFNPYELHKYYPYEGNIPHYTKALSKTLYIHDLDICSDIEYNTNINVIGLLGVIQPTKYNAAVSEIYTTKGHMEVKINNSEFIKYLKNFDSGKELLLFNILYKNYRRGVLFGVKQVKNILFKEEIYTNE